ncbi:TPA: efflux transporter periplasmic adaptor subunit [Klebsiella michiganensis]|nr:efflux transporter periplasmic adaptor subunit [Klebsiella michiganensis]
MSLLLAVELCEHDHLQQMVQNSTSEVGIMMLTEENTTLTAEDLGSVFSLRAAEARPQVDCRLQTRLLDERNIIEAGWTLHQIDPALYWATFAIAGISPKSSEIFAQRNERLYEKRAISQQAWDDIHSSWSQAKAGMNSVRIDLWYVKVITQISGSIDRSSVTQRVLSTTNQEGSPVTIKQLEPINMDFPQYSRILLKLLEKFAEGRMQRSGGRQVDVGLLPDYSWEYAYIGKFTDVTVDVSTKAVIILIELSTPEGHLLVEIFLHAKELKGDENNFLAPQKSCSP